MPPSSLDNFYRRLIKTRFFEKGWGKPENLKRLFEFKKIISNRTSCYTLIPKDYPVEITREEKSSDCTILEGNFISPLELHVPNLIPKECRIAHFQVILPNKWNHEKHKPICIHLAGTGDHYFWRRRAFIAKPLLREANIGAIILENPFYGLRKPVNQTRSNLLNVSDIFVMGGCLILESLVLFNWCERHGYGPLGITGISLGGHMASLAATNWPKPLVLVPCLSWSTASTAFTQGVLSQSINWDILETQYHADGNYRERLSKMVTIIDEAFMAGQKFAKNFTKSMDALHTDIFEVKNENICNGTISLPPESITNHDSNKNNVIINEKNNINENNNIKLNDNLLKKFMTKESELSDTEMNELSDKIDKIKKKISTEKQKRVFLKESTILNLQALTSKKINENKESVVTLVENANINKQTTEKSNVAALTKLMNYILPKSTQNNVQNKIDITKTKWWEREALQFMRGVMDECTHLKNFSIPYDTSLIIAVAAKDDAYIPREGLSRLEDIWPGAEVRYLDAGHVSAYVLHQKLFRACIIEAFERAKKKAESESHQFDCENLEISITYKQLMAKYNTLNVTS